MPAPSPPARSNGPRDASPAPTADASSLPSPPTIDSALLLQAERAAEYRLAADSAADQVVLEKLAHARPGAGERSEELSLPDAVRGEKALTASGVTWDIDVATFNNHDRVQYYLDFFQTTGRERMGIWLTRMPHYEPMIRRRLQQGGLPSDLVYLALIESGFSNTAVSTARATGMWQFMKGTARLYGLRVDPWVDERRDPARATDAAARFLGDLYKRFGSYYLAAAAYNAGGGKISRSIDKLEDDDEADTLVTDATFFRLYDTKLLHRETKDYVPKLIAAALIAKEPQRYGFTPPPATDSTAFDSVVVSDMTSLDIVARLADTTLAAVRELNPQYLRLATPPGTHAVVRLPTGRGEATQAAYASLPASERVSFQVHLTGPRETLAGVARRYGVSARSLHDANPGVRSGRLKTGQRLIVPTGGLASALVARQMVEPPPSLFHRVRRGETIVGIADRYDVSTRRLRQWNALGKHGRIRPGMRLRVAPRGAAPVVHLATAGQGGRSSGGATRAGPHAKGGAEVAEESHGVRVHYVRRGDTLTAVARQYGVTLQALKSANGLTGNAKIKAGISLRIPA